MCTVEAPRAEGSGKVFLSFLPEPSHFLEGLSCDILARILWVIYTCITAIVQLAVLNNCKVGKHQLCCKTHVQMQKQYAPSNAISSLLASSTVIHYSELHKIIYACTDYQKDSSHSVNKIPRLKLGHALNFQPLGPATDHPSSKKQSWKWPEFQFLFKGKTRGEKHYLWKLPVIIF